MTMDPVIEFVQVLDTTRNTPGKVRHIRRAGYLGNLEQSVQNQCLCGLYLSKTDIYSPAPDDLPICKNCLKHLDAITVPSTADSTGIENCTIYYRGTHYTWGQWAALMKMDRQLSENSNGGTAKAVSEDADLSIREEIEQADQEVWYRLAQTLFEKMDLSCTDTDLCQILKTLRNEGILSDTEMPTYYEKMRCNTQMGETHYQCYLPFDHQGPHKSFGHTGENTICVSWGD